MNKKEVNEIKRRYKKESNNFDRVRVAYVNAEKNIIAELNENFMTLDETAQFRYMDVAKKSLSGKIGNNLIDVNFTLDAEAEGHIQDLLTKLRDSRLNDDNIVREINQIIIDNYDTVNNYLIVMMHDTYDVPIKTEDGITQDDSDSVYDYVIISICPLALSKSEIGYEVEDAAIEILEGRWTTKAPETAIIFPAFNYRTADVNSAVVYTKSSKEPHTEVFTEILESEVVETADIVKNNIEGIISTNLKENGADDETVNEKVLLFHKGLHDKLEEIGAAKDDTNDFDILKLSDDVLTDVLLNTAKIEEDVVENITNVYKEEVDADSVYISKIVDENRLSKEALLLENIKLKEQITRLLEQIDEMSKK